MCMPSVDGFDTCIYVACSVGGFVYSCRGSTHWLVNILLFGVD